MSFKTIQGPGLAVTAWVLTPRAGESGPVQCLLWSSGARAGRHGLSAYPTCWRVSTMFTMILRGQGWQARPECLPHVLESQDQYNVYYDPQGPGLAGTAWVLAPIPHWLLPAVRDLTCDVRLSTYMKVYLSCPRFHSGRMRKHGTPSESTITNKTCPAGSFSSS
jgi:hypothetical protein